MKKTTLILLTMLLFGIALTVSAKDITIYVQADQQPNIHYWGSVTSSEWPGEKLTETTIVNNLENLPVTLYYKTFSNLADDAKVSFVFNYDGDADKTADITDISDDRYYFFKGNHEFEDITSQFKDDIQPQPVADATIEKVQLPGSFCSWTGDNASMTDNGDKTYSYTLNLTESTEEFIEMKLLVADGVNSHWLGFDDLKLEAPDGWAQKAASDGNIQLNIAAIGIKEFTVKATWGGGENASANWTLVIDGDANALINHVQLPSTLNDWNGDNAVFEKAQDGTYSYNLDLTEYTDATLLFKLLVNDRHWLGYGDLVEILAPDGWIQEAENNGNIQLNVADTGEKKFTFKAIWTANKIGSAGWSLVLSTTTTVIGAALNDKGQMRNAQVLFNLAGQRVMQPTKGLYIQNGRKYMVK